MLTTRLGWFGAVAYALPILEVWLLTQLSEQGAVAFLVVLQVLWVLVFLAVLDRCVRGSKAYRAAASVVPEASPGRQHPGVAPAVPSRAAARPPRSLRSSRDRRRSHR